VCGSGGIVKKRRTGFTRLKRRGRRLRGHEGEAEMSYSDESKAHDERVKGLVALYNARRLDDMLEHFCDDVICFLPTVLADSPIDIQWSNGKETYRRNLAIFYDLFGTLTVEGVFATKDSSSVLVTDEHGNNGTFSFEVTAERCPAYAPSRQHPPNPYLPEQRQNSLAYRLSARFSRRQPERLGPSSSSSGHSDRCRADRACRARSPCRAGTASPARPGTAPRSRASPRVRPGL
jgi:hypothetical protein